MPHLRVVGDARRPAARSATSARLVSRLDQVRGRAGRRGGRCRGRRGRASRRAGPAGRRPRPGRPGRRSGVRTPPVSTTVVSGAAELVEQLRRPGTELVTTVRPRDVAQRAGDLVGRGAGREARPWRRARTSRGGRAAMACFSAGLQGRLRLEPRLVGGPRPTSGGGAAVDPLDQPTLGEHARCRGGRSCPRRRGARPGRRRAPRRRLRHHGRGCGPGAGWPARSPLPHHGAARRREPGQGRPPRRRPTRSCP